MADTGISLEQLQAARTVVGDLHIAGVVDRETWFAAVDQIDRAVTELISRGEPGWVFSHGRVREVRQNA